MIYEWDKWEHERWPQIREILKKIPISEIIKEIGLSRREIYYLKGEEKTPGIETAKKIEGWISEYRIPIAHLTDVISVEF